MNQLGYLLMLAFAGQDAPLDILQRVRSGPLGGFSLFRQLNGSEPARTRAMTAALQAAAREAGLPPLLIAADQEGGQLAALNSSTTSFPGNMALAAIGDGDLAFRVGRALGLELAAMGVNIDYAPVCDVNTNPLNPVIGVRAFGDDPQLAACLGSEMISGIQSAGVAATAKHFPGNGGTGADPHFTIPIVRHDRDRLEAVDLAPFRAAIEAGVRLIMTAHVAMPGLTGRDDLPATLSPEVLTGLLREEMGFEGVVISDALDMEAITQGSGQIADVVAALQAGVDLLLAIHPKVQERVTAGLELADSLRLLSLERQATSVGRVLALKRWVAAQEQPGLDVVGCREHRELSAEVARRSVTLVRDEGRLLPISLAPDGRVLALMPRPADLTPADTSSAVHPALGEALRAYHPQVDELLFAQNPDAVEIAALREAACNYQVVVLGTISAHLQPGQAALARALLELPVPVITAALRTPYDLDVYPQAGTHLATYSIQPESLRALAAGLFGRQPFVGRMPVRGGRLAVGG